MTKEKILARVIIGVLVLGVLGTVIGIAGLHGLGVLGVVVGIGLLVVLFAWAIENWS